MRESLALFYHAPFRFILSLLAVFVGMAAVCTLLTVDFTVRHHALVLLKKYGENRFFAHVTPNSLYARKWMHRLLSPSAVLKWSQGHAHTVQVVPYHTMQISFHLQFHRYNAFLVGTDVALFSVMQWPFLQGAPWGDSPMHRKVVVVGNEVLAKHTAQGVGERISINGNYYTIIGVLEPVDTDPLLDFEVNQTIFFPMEHATRMQPIEWIEDFIVQAQCDTIAGSEASFKQKLQRDFQSVNVWFRHGEAFQRAFLNQLDTTLRLLRVIACLTLFLGIVSMLNLLFALIGERKQEIGLRLALGATQKQLSWHFLQEAVALFFMGGVGGIVLGQLTAYIIVKGLGMHVYGVGPSMLLGFCLSVGLGLLVGVGPALWAARFDPAKLLNS